MVILGLGSNCGDRLGYLQQAMAYLQDGIIENMVASPIYESQALLKEGAPDEWNKPYLNMAVKGKTHLEPYALLGAVKKIEKTLDRSDSQPLQWAPRTIDIDILAFDNVYMQSQTLTIPHSELPNRNFALKPLLDIAPDWIFPSNVAHVGGVAALKHYDTLHQKQPLSLSLYMDIHMAAS